MKIKNGYRLLKEGEIIEKNDQYFNLSNEDWCPAASIGQAWNPANMLPYIRPIPKAETKFNDKICIRVNSLKEKMAVLYHLFNEDGVSGTEKLMRLCLEHGDSYSMFPYIVLDENGKARSTSIEGIERYVVYTFSELSDFLKDIKIRKTNETLLVPDGEILIFKDAFCINNTPGCIIFINQKTLNRIEEIQKTLS